MIAIRILGYCLVVLSGGVSVAALSFAEPNKFHLSRTWTAPQLGLEVPLGGLLFSVDGATLYVVGNSERDQSRLYRVPVVRAPSGEVTALGPARSVSVAFWGAVRGLDAGLDFGPGGHLYFTYWPANIIAQKQGGISGAESRSNAASLGLPESVAGLTFSPHATDPGAGFGWMQLSIWSLTGNRNIYRVGLRPEADGRFLPTGSELFAVLPRQGTGAIQYVPEGQFRGDMMFVNWDFGEIGILAIDPGTGLAIDRSSGSPLLGTSNPLVYPFASGLGKGPWGLEFDPVTHDFFVSTWGGDPESSILQIQGEGFQAPCEVAEISVEGPMEPVLEGTTVTIVAHTIAGSVSAWQWFHGDRAITGATDSVLTVPAVSLSDVGRYRVLADSCSEQSFSGPFELEINPRMVEPRLEFPAEVYLLEDGRATLPGRLVDEDSRLASVRLRVGTSDADLLPLTSVQIDRTDGQLQLAIVPPPDAFGEAELMILAVDPDGNRVQKIVKIVVEPVNDPPHADPVARQTLPSDQDAMRILVTGVGSGPVNEMDALEVATELSTPDIVYPPTVQFTSTGSELALEILRKNDSGGIVTVSLLLDDGNEQNARVTHSFQLEVEPRATSHLALEWIEPAGNAVLDAGANGKRDVRLVVGASDAISRVSFFAWDRLLSVDDSRPFEWVWPDVGVGDFEVTAKGESGSGQSVENPVRFGVAHDPAISIIRDHEGEPLIQIVGAPGLYIVEAATSFSSRTHWETYRQFRLTDSVARIEFQANSGGESIFFRLRSVAP